MDTKTTRAAKPISMAQTMFQNLKRTHKANLLYVDDDRHKKEPILQIHFSTLNDDEKLIVNIEFKKDKPNSIYIEQYIKEWNLFEPEYFLSSPTDENILESLQKHLP